MGFLPVLTECGTGQIHICPQEPGTDATDEGRKEGRKAGRKEGRERGPRREVGGSFAIKVGKCHGVRESSGGSKRDDKRGWGWGVEGEWWGEGVGGGGLTGAEEEGS